VKTTLEIPDAIFRRAKAKAVQRGIPFRQFVTEAVADKLRVGGKAAEKPWMRLAGRLRGLHAENARINRTIEQAFETIEPEEWT
jgi:hypothetical protein